MKKLILLGILFLVTSISSFGEYWERLNSIIDPVDNFSVNSNGDIFFSSKYIDRENGLIDSLTYLWRLPNKSPNPIKCLSTSDTILQIFVAKNDAILVFTGTKRDDGYQHSSFCKAVYRSTDNGLTWNKQNCKIYGDLKIEQNNQGILFLTGVKVYPSDDVLSSTKLYFSEDFGLNWQESKWNKGFIRYFDVLKDDNLLLVSDSTMFLSRDNSVSWDSICIINKFLDYNNIAENSRGILYTSNFAKSSDTGRKWQNIGLVGQDTLQYIKLFSKDEIYSLSKTRNLYKSIDEGDSWEFILNAANEFDSTSNLCLFEYQDCLFVLTSQDSNAKFKIFKLDYSSKIFIDCFGDILKNPYLKKSESYNYFPFYYFDKSGILLITYKAHFQQITFDPMAIITDFYTLPFAEVEKIKISPLNTLILDVSDHLSNNCRYISRNMGLTWQLITDSIFMRPLFISDNNIIYTGYNHQLYGSNDDFKTFYKIGNPFPDTLINQDNIYFTFARSNKGYFYCFNKPPFYLSTDNGETWSERKGSSITYNWMGMNDILFDKNDVIYLNNIWFFFRSTDYGDSWDKIYQASDEGGNIAIDLFGNLYIHYFVLLKSTDKGNNWSTLNHPENNSGTLLINKSGTMFIGDYHTTDYGMTWIYNGHDGYIACNEGNTFLAENDRYDYPGLFLFNNSTSAETYEIISTNNLIISPNPASDYITVSVGANGYSPESIKIFDVFGEEVNLTPTLSTSGEGVKIDVSSLSPGVYFVKVGERVSKFLKVAR